MTPGPSSVLTDYPWGSARRNVLALVVQGESYRDLLEYTRACEARSFTATTCDWQESGDDETQEITATSGWVSLGVRPQFMCAVSAN